MQLSGSFRQSVLQRKRSHDSQPIGGVRAKPLRRAVTALAKKITLINEFIR